MADRELVRLGLHQKAALLQIGDDLLARVEALHLLVVAAVLVHVRVGREDIDARELVVVAQAKSLKSWAGVTFTAPVPKSLSTRMVGDDRDLAVGQGELQLLADQRL
jgi:hypothetical protein